MHQSLTIKLYTSEIIFYMLIESPHNETEQIQFKSYSSRSTLRYCYVNLILIVHYTFQLICNMLF